MKLETMTTFSSVLALISLKMLDTASSFPAVRTDPQEVSHEGESQRAE